MEHCIYKRFARDAATVAVITLIYNLGKAIYVISGLTLLQ